MDSGSVYLDTVAERENPEVEKLCKRVSIVSQPKRKCLDDFIELGWYTLFVSAITETSILIQVCTMMFMIHAGAAPTVVGCGDHMLNGTDSERCTELLKLRETTGCTPKLDYQFYSVNIEFDKLCSEGREVKNSISLQMLGVFIGSAVFGQISDSFGRKITLLVCMTGVTVFNFVASFAGSLTMFTVWKATAGFFCGGHMMVLYVYFLEQVPRKHALWIAGFVTWSPNYILLALISYLSQDWRSYSRIVSYLSIPGLILLAFSCESPRWCLQKGKYSEVKKIVKTIRCGLRDDPKISEEVDMMIQLEVERSKLKAISRQHYVYHLFYTKKLATYTVVLGLGYFIITVINYSLLFNMGTLSGSIFLNAAFFGLTRWFVNLLAGVLDYAVPALGRKIIQLATNALILAALTVTFLIYAFDAKSEFGFLLRYSTLGAAAMTSQGYITKSLCVVELFPTAIRNNANSMMGAASRVGSMLGPQIFLLEALWPALPYFVMFGLIIVELFGFQFLIPETKGKPLSDHLPTKGKRQRSILKNGV